MPLAVGGFEEGYGTATADEGGHGDGASSVEQSHVYPASSTG